MEIKPKLFIISGPSGVGKGTLVKKILERVPNLHRSVSITTRAPRPAETHGIDYFFVTKDEFDKIRDSGKLLEWAFVHGNYYGTLKSQVEESLSSGKDVVLEIDPQGARQIKEKIKDSVLIFIAPPSLEELKSRLKKRKTESSSEFELRLKNAQKEMKLLEDYDYKVVNDEVERAVKELEEIILSERRRHTH